ncbi:MAG TPA: hypothetical protein VH170_06700 [Chthoniobacterales bacterium]|jgi:hypothetical protein|nr:hypothetical protein [Chthoniobacterales bacterium]
MRNIARACFKTNRQKCYAVSVLLITLLSRAHAAAPDPVHLSGTETITGFKTDTNSWTFSNSASTLLLGTTAIPNLSSTISGAQLLISTSNSNPNWPFAVVGGYRYGASGERYYSGFYPDGHFSTNEYIVISGGGYGVPDSPPYMAYIGQDVGIGILQVGAFTDSGPSSNVKLYEGWGPSDSGGRQAKVFDLGTQGTIWLFNPYGQTGAVQYDLPQIVLGDIGSNYATPSWTYGAFRQHNGHLRIGTYDGQRAEGGELDVSAGQVSVAGSFIISPNAPSSAAAAGAQGTIAWDSNYLYICVAPNTWKRAPLTSW